MYKKNALLMLAFLSFCSVNIQAARFVPGGGENNLEKNPQANDDYASVVVGLQPTVSGNLAANDINGDFVTIDGSSAGKYGFVTVDSSGAYTYTLFENEKTAGLASGETVTDEFSYTYSILALDGSTLKSGARLIIQVNGNRSELTANDFNASILVGSGDNITGNISENNKGGERVQMSSSPGSRYGFMTLDADGSFTYRLNENVPELEKLSAGESITDTFTYSYYDQFGKSVSATIYIRIYGSNALQLIAVDDDVILVVNKATFVTGSITDNDSNGERVSLTSSPISQYGYLELDPYGDFTYTIDENAPEIPEGSVVTDTFTYTYFGKSGSSATAQINVQIYGNQTEAPHAVDDNVTVVVNKTPEVTGDVTSNDSGGETVELSGSPVSKYGYLVLNLDGTYIYTVNQNAPEVAALGLNEVVKDSFTYVYSNTDGQSATAQINVKIYGNPQVNPSVLDDNITFVVNQIVPDSNPPKLIVAVESQVINEGPVQITGPSASKYGYLVLHADGSYTYTLYRDSPDVINLKAGEVIIDTFTYEYLNEFKQTGHAKINVRIIGNPIDSNGRVVFPGADGASYHNVDVEFNDRSAQATPLNSARNLRGQLHNGHDKDWFSFSSAGNEIITLELCPMGSTCFAKKSWVMYVFDSDKLTKGMEEKSYPLFQTTYEESGTVVSQNIVGSGNHMYLAKDLGYFDGALIGVIDPCFDTNNSVSIGVGEGARNYYVAISSPLRGSKLNAEGINEPIDECGHGSSIFDIAQTITLKGIDTDGEPVDITRTVVTQNTQVFPYSDDQYSIKVTGTGIHPLLSPEAAAKSATFSSSNGELKIPKIRILDSLYAVDLNKQNTVARSAHDGGLKFGLSAISLLDSGEKTDAFQATYNPKNKQVIVPRVTDNTTGDAYSMTMQYHSKTEQNDAWLDIVSIEIIK